MNDNLTISTFELLQRFPDAESARLYFEGRRWSGHVVCPHCGCDSRISARKGERTGYYRCGECKEEFTVRTRTIFERSHVPLNKWLYAMYLTVTARKGISSLQLSKQIGVTQKTAWFMQQRLREACGNDDGGMLKRMTGYNHAHVKHSAGEYVGSNDIHTNGIESVWAVLKRGLYDVWHHASHKNLHRFVDEATFRLNEANCEVHTIDRLNEFSAKAFLHRITYKEVIA